MNKIARNIVIYASSLAISFYGYGHTLEKQDDILEFYGYERKHVTWEEITSLELVVGATLFLTPGVLPFECARLVKQTFDLETSEYYRYKYIINGLVEGTLKPIDIDDIIQDILPDESPKITPEQNKELEPSLLLNRKIKKIL